MSIQFLQFAPLLAVLIAAAIQDWKQRRIANYLTLPLLLAGIVHSILHGNIGWQSSLLGITTGFCLTIILFIMQAMGGGDVKLLSAIGAWLGPIPTLAVFAASAIIGMLIVITQAIAQRRLGVLVRNSAVLTMSLACADQVGTETIAELGSKSSSVRKPLPYAVPILVATVIVLAYLAGR